MENNEQNTQNDPFMSIDKKPTANGWKIVAIVVIAGSVISVSGDGLILEVDYVTRLRRIAGRDIDIDLQCLVDRAGAVAVRTGRIDDRTGAVTVRTGPRALETAESGILNRRDRPGTVALRALAFARPRSGAVTVTFAAAH